MKNRPQARQARLVLEDGSEYAGYSFGKARSQAGEAVFTTAMTGYPQSLTDPGYRGQILVSAYPLMGNCGAPVKPKTLEPFTDAAGLPLHFESLQVQVAGFAVSDACDEPSHYSSGGTLSAWLEKRDIPGVWGIDTRSLAKRLRESGSMRGKILVEGCREVTMDSGAIPNPVEEVSPAEVSTLRPEGSGAAALLKIAVIDCGAKANAFRCLLARNVEIIRLPWNRDPHDIDYDGLIVAGGPGDPKACGRTIAAVRRAFDRKKPIFGINLGNLVMALAAGADTYKLPHGHRGLSQPCLEAGSPRCHITSQNHGYAVRAESLPREWQPWFVNANDGTIEGIRSSRHPFAGTQFNPEGCPGPRDTEFLLDRFLEEVKTAGKK